MFYHSSDGWNFIPSMNTKAYILFFFRVLSNYLYIILTTILLWYYVSTLQSLLVYSDVTIMKSLKILIIIFDFVFLLASIVYSTFYVSIKRVIIVFLTMSLIIAILSVYYCTTILHWLRSTGSNNQKIHGRFLLISIVGVFPLVIDIIYFSFRLLKSAYFDRYLS